MYHPLEAISAYLDGELEPEDRHAVEQHLGKCEDCQRILDEYRQVDGQFKGIVEEITPTMPSLPRRRHARKWPVTAAIIAAMGLTIGLMVANPNVGGQALQWFTGGRFFSEMEETVARTAFTVSLPEVLPAKAKQMPALLSDPDGEGRFQRVEFVWTGAPEASREPYLLLNQGLSSEGNPVERMSGEGIRIQGHYGRLDVREYQENGRLVTHVRLVWTDGDVLFHLHSRAVGVEELITIAESMQVVGSELPRDTEAGDHAGWHDAGPTDQYAIPSVTHFPEAHFFLVRLPEGFMAFYDLDPHLRHIVTWDSDEGLFVSPAHGERYTIDGTPVAGPAPRGLDRYPVKVEGGRVLVDLGTLLPQEKPEVGSGRVEPSEGP